MSEKEVPIRIVITKDGDAFLPNARRLGMMPWENHIGDHEFCRGAIYRRQTSAYGGVIACQGGCNLRVTIPWPIEDYHRLLNHFNLLNQPQPPANPAAADG